MTKSEPGPTGYSSVPMSFVGGAGGMFGTFLGTMFLGVLQNGLIIASISAYWQGVISGAVLIASVLIDRFRRLRGF